MPEDYDIPYGMEPKWRAVKRLEREGRLEAFRARQRELMNVVVPNGKPGSTEINKTEAFYAALKEFQPQGL